MTSRAPLHSNIYTHTHTYTHVRFKVLTALVFITRVLYCRQKTHAFSMLFVATGDKKNSSPRRSIGGDEFFSIQLRLDDNVPGNKGPVSVRSWRCRILEQRNKREWLVVCSDDAFPDSRFGFVCDCGRWTWGDDEFHAPVFSRVTDRVVAGRRKTSCRR